jgi:ribosomal protein L11 methylase PrmA
LGGGLALARHIFDHPETVAGCRVLDLSAGSGIVGFAAAKAGAEAVVAADTDPYATAAIGLNAAANGVAVAPFLEIRRQGHHQMLTLCWSATSSTTAILPRVSPPFSNDASIKRQSSNRRSMARISTPHPAPIAG